jgi:hypothetical protein
MNSISQSSAPANRRAIVISPRQASVAVFLGGPVACAYFIRMNYVAIGDLISARKVLQIGAALILLWNIVIALDVLMPKPASIAFDLVLKAAPFVLVFCARQRVQKQFESLPSQYDVCSNWNVLGTTLLCLVASIGSILPAVAIVVAVTLLTAG